MNAEISELLTSGIAHDIQAIVEILQVPGATTEEKRAGVAHATAAILHRIDYAQDESVLTQQFRDQITSLISDMIVIATEGGE